VASVASAVQRVSIVRTRHHIVADWPSGKEDNFKQFARIDSGFLAWDFWLKDGDDRMSLLSLSRADDDRLDCEH
jgi:hypothetical protein